MSKVHISGEGQGCKYQVETLSWELDERNVENKPGMAFKSYFGRCLIFQNYFYLSSELKLSIIQCHDLNASLKRAEVYVISNSRVNDWLLAC